MLSKRIAVSCVLSCMIATLACTVSNPGDCRAESEQTFRAPRGGAVWTRDGNPAGKELTWDEAHDFMRELNSGRYGGCAAWRLPSRDELTALLDWVTSGDTDGESVTPEPDFYWSSTTDSLEPEYAYAVNMGDGSVDNCDKSDFNYVWPVCGR